jgi:TPR repeat protein
MLTTPMLALAFAFSFACADPATSPQGRVKERVKAAHAGNPNDQYWLGARFYYGIDVERDFTQAVHWFQRAADQGNAPAQYALAVLYRNGLGLEQDDVLSKTYLERAALQGLAEAQFQLSTLYITGKGVEEDWDEVTRLTRLAAVQSYPPALKRLGLLYEKGTGVEQDDGESLRWYRIAAEEGADAVHAPLAMAYSRNGRMGEALTAAREAVRLDPGEVRSHLTLAILLEQDGQAEATISALHAALEIDPNDSHVLNNLAWQLATSSEPRLRDPERALELAQLAIANSEVPEANMLDTLAEAHFVNGHFEEAIEAAQQALAAGPDPRDEGIMREHLEKYRQALSTHRSSSPLD